MSERPWIEIATSRCLNVISIGKWLVNDGRDIPDTLCPFIEHYLMATPFDFDWAGAEQSGFSTHVVVLGKGVQITAVAYKRRTWLGELSLALPQPFTKAQLLTALFDSIQTISTWHDPKTAFWIKGDEWKIDGAILLPDGERKVMALVERARAGYPEPPEPVTEVSWLGRPYRRLKG